MSSWNLREESNGVRYEGFLGVVIFMMWRKRRSPGS